MPKEKAVSGRAAQENRYLNPVAEYLPIYKIENGIIYTKDYRYVKIVEVNPVNFMLRSSREQRSIIYSFIGFLKISPVKVHFKVLTKCADINRHVEMIRREMETETDALRMLGLRVPKEEQAWWEGLGLSDYDEGRDVTRLEAAVAIDDLIDPFMMFGVDYYGNVMLY